MKEIVKTLLLEGIDEDTIHRVIDVISEKVSQGKRWQAAVNSLAKRKEEMDSAKKAYFGKSPEKRYNDQKGFKKMSDAITRYDKADNLASTRGYGGAPAGSSSEVINKGNGYKEYVTSNLYGPSSRESAKGQGWTEDYGSYEKKLESNKKNK